MEQSHPAMDRIGSNYLANRRRFGSLSFSLRETFSTTAKSYKTLESHRSQFFTFNS